MNMKKEAQLSLFFHIHMSIISTPTPVRSA